MFPSDNPIIEIPDCADHLGTCGAVTEPTLPADQSNKIWINLLQILFKLAPDQLKLTRKMEDTLVWTE